MKPLRNRGFRAVEVGDHDLDEVVELRLRPEVPAVTCLAHRRISAAMPNLEALATATEYPATDREVKAFLARIRDFHLALLKFQDNQRLVDYVWPLRDQTRLSALTELARRSLLKGAAAVDQPILEALTLSVHQNTSNHLRHIRRDLTNGSSPSARLRISHVAGAQEKSLACE